MLQGFKGPECILTGWRPELAEDILAFPVLQDFLADVLRMIRQHSLDTVHGHHGSMHNTSQHFKGSVPGPRAYCCSFVMFD